MVTHLPVMRRSRWKLALCAFLICAAVAVAYWRVFASVPAPSVADIRYGADDAQKLDLWLPAGKGPFPVVLAVHGGAFAYGDKRGNDGLKADIEALRAAGI